MPPLILSFSRIGMRRCQGVPAVGSHSEIPWHP